MIKLQIKVVTLWPEGVDEELGRGGGGGSGRKRRSEYQWDILTLSSQSQLYVNEDLPALIRTVLARFTESSCQSHKLYDMTCCQHQQQQNLQ